MYTNNLPENESKYINQSTKPNKKDKDEIIKNNVIFVDIYRHCKLIKCNTDCSFIVGSDSNIIYIFKMASVGPDIETNRDGFYRLNLESFVYNFCITKTGQFLF